MKFFIVTLVAGLLAHQRIGVSSKLVTSAVLTPDDATKAVADTVKAAGDTAAAGVAQTQAAAGDALKSAGAAAADPMGALTNLAGGMDMSKMAGITGAFNPLLSMAKELTTNSIGAGKMALVGNLKAVQAGMNGMKDSTQSLPMVGALFSPMFGLGASFANMPISPLNSIFDGLNRMISMTPGMPAAGATKQ
ncbi:uncharacterized protein LOC111051402 isoform X1 [Nilaparvata lugens]|uniref:uncharacterized protein LOC111051402 isoform X1 n=1 Tax=Nilaparvata lugens TaxID=108931 RepID=UPI00193D96C2|nr:uncharacterized protein LOC111051402 isoform X1 [Nilaparvata lugens]